MGFIFHSSLKMIKTASATNFKILKFVLNFFYPFLGQQNQFEQQIWFQLKSSVTICTKVMPLWLKRSVTRFAKVMPLWLKRSVTIFTKVMPLWQNFKSLIVYLLIIWGIQVLIIFLFKLATLHPPVKSLLQLFVLSCRIGIKGFELTTTTTAARTFHS